MTRFLTWLRSLFSPKPGKCEICGVKSEDLKNGLCDTCYTEETTWPI